MLEFDEQIEIAAVGIETARDCGPEETEPPHVKSAAEIAKSLDDASEYWIIRYGIVPAHDRSLTHPAPNAAVMLDDLQIGKTQGAAL